MHTYIRYIRAADRPKFFGPARPDVRPACCVSQITGPTRPVWISDRPGPARGQNNGRRIWIGSHYVDE